MSTRFTEFVEFGRVVFINNGPARGKIAVIVDIIDQNRVLLDGPKELTGFPRQSMNLNDINLTKIVIPISRGAATEEVTSEFKKADVQAQWEATEDAKRFVAQEKRLNLTDFDRFVVSVLKAKKNAILKAETEKARKGDTETLKKIEKKKSDRDAKYQQYRLNLRKKYMAIGKKAAYEGAKAKAEAKAQ